MAASLHAELLRRSATIGTAESITGSGLGALMTAAPGASETYRGGVVSYATDVKQGLLGVSAETIEKYGVVSAECAREMALGTRSLLTCDYAVSTTGVAGPDSQEGKPVGTVFVAVADGVDVTVKELSLSGDRSEIRDASCREAVSAVLAVVVGVAD